MNSTELKRALSETISTAQAAGALLRQNLNTAKRVNSSTQHDVKLELDVRSQRLIERRLHKAFPEVAFLGEEGVSGEEDSGHRWVVDPIDGTVNFSHGIPHACVSIALQERSRSVAAKTDGGYRTVLGVVYDPFMDELWSASKSDPARLNGRKIQVSRTAKLERSIVAMGYGKDRQTLRRSLGLFRRLSLATQKVRNMGAAALALTYVATGRFDAYVERSISIWDVAAAGFILERAGGEFWRQPLSVPLTYRMISSNGKLRSQIHAVQ